MLLTKMRKKTLKQVWLSVIKLIYFLSPASAKIGWIFLFYFRCTQVAILFQMHTGDNDQQIQHKRHMFLSNSLYLTNSNIEYISLYCASLSWNSSKSWLNHWSVLLLTDLVVLLSSVWICSFFALQRKQHWWP